MKTLYLGLNPKPGTVHYPVFRTEFCGPLEPALALWPQFTHIIFTSQTAVGYWPGPWDKQLIAIGPATAAALQKKGLEPLIAPEATQEGIIALIAQIDGYFFLPRSRLARSALTDYMQVKKIPFFALDLYNTVFQKPEPVPDLAQFDEIVFTSPSTVEGFLRIYGALPKDKKLTSIGPITEKALYTNAFKSWEYDKEAAQIFVPGASDHCLWQGASEGQKFAAKPTMSETNF